MSCFEDLFFFWIYYCRFLILFFVVVRLEPFLIKTSSFWFTMFGSTRFRKTDNRILFVCWNPILMKNVFFFKFGEWCFRKRPPTNTVEITSQCFPLCSWPFAPRKLFRMKKRLNCLINFGKIGFGSRTSPTHGLMITTKIHWMPPPTSTSAMF